jgi:hypothetical protein
MNDKDKWSGHLEYLKAAITLATAILAVSAAVYSDATKIPTDYSKYFLLTAATFVFVTLVSSIIAVIHLCNFLIRPDDTQPDLERAAKITWYAGGSFFGLLLAGFFITLFFALRTFYGGVTPPPGAIEASTDVLQKQIDLQTEKLVLDEFMIKGTDYLIDYIVIPGNRKFHVVFDPTKGRIESIKRLP